MPFKRQRIRDPLHSIVEFQPSAFEDAMWRVVRTRPFQRLRRIKQLGFSDLVYPGATHSRFAHSVGVFHTAKQLMNVVKVHMERENSFESNRADRALAASLVHDVGHGPFSHAFEEVGRRLGLKMARHEFVSDALIRNGEISQVLNGMWSGFANDVADVVGSSGPGDIYSAVVSSQFDADRLDYMRRDRLMTGTQHSAIDFDWLIANLEVGNVAHGVDESAIGNVDTFVLGPKAFYAAEAYVLGLFQLYPTVYYHKTTRGAEKLYVELLCQAISLIRDSSAATVCLSDSHPLVRFARDPESLDRVLELDDSVIWGALSMMADSTDALVSGFAKRLRDRKLFKCVDVRHRLAISLGADKASESTVEPLCNLIREKIDQWKSEHPDNAARILIDEGQRIPYREFQESTGLLNQIIIRTVSGELIDLGKQSKVVDALKPFRLFRVYHAAEDQEAYAFIEKAIAMEVEAHGRATQA